MDIAAAGKGAVEAAAPALNSTAGFFLIGCLVIALALIVIQGVISYRLAASEQVDPAQLREAARQVKEASRALSDAAEESEAVTQALKDAVLPARGAKRRGAQTVQLFRNTPQGLAASEHATIDDLSDALELLDADEMVDRLPARRAREAADTARHADTKATQALEKAEEDQKTSFFGIVQQITRKQPFIGAALLFVLVGALGADLINFSVS